MKRNIDWVSICIDMLIGYIRGEFVTKEMKARFSLVAESCLEVISHVSVSIDNLVFYYAYLIDGFYRIDMPDEAIKLFKSTKLLLENSDTSDLTSEMRFMFYHNACRVLNQQGELLVARKLLNEIAKYYKRYKDFERRDYKTLYETYLLLSENYRKDYDVHYTVSFHYLKLADSLVSKLEKDEAMNFITVALGRAMLYNELEKDSHVYELLKYISEIICEIEVSDRNIIAFCSNLSDIAFLYGELGMYEKSLDCNFALLNYEKDLFDEDKNLDISTTLHNIGYSFMGLGNNTRALDFYYKSLQYREMLMDSITANTYDLIAETYEAMGETTKTLDFLFKALAIYLEDENTGNIPFEVTYEWIGQCYYKLGKLVEAAKYYNLSQQYMSDDVE